MMYRGTISEHVSFDTKDELFAYKQGKSDKLSEVKEVLASMVINEVISVWAYDHICILLGVEA